MQAKFPIRIAQRPELESGSSTKNTRGSAASVRPIALRADAAAESALAYVPADAPVQHFRRWLTR